MNSKIVRNIASGPGNPRNSEGSFIQLNDGRLMFIYSRYNGDSWNDHAAADIAALYSSDGGETWGGEPEILVRNEGNGNLMSVSLLRLQDGRIALLYLCKTFIGEVCDCRPMICFSCDEGASWSKPAYCIHAPGYYVVNNDRLIQLKSGRLLIAAGFHRWNIDNNCNVHGRSVACVFYSDDGGANWQEAPGWVLPPQESNTGLQEPGVIELADGRVMAWFRTDLGCQYKAFSCDGGMNWSHAIPAPEFKCPASPLSMKRMPSGELAAVWNDHNVRWGVVPHDGSWWRTPLVLAFSTDEGVTWERHMLLEDSPTHGYCYIAMHFTADALLLGYCCGGDGTSVLQDACIRKITLI